MRPPKKSWIDTEIGSSEVQDRLSGRVVKRICLKGCDLVKDFANLPPGNWTKDQRGRPTLCLGDFRVSLSRNLSATTGFASDEDYDDVRLEFWFHMNMWRHPSTKILIHRSSPSLEGILEEVSSALVELHVRTEGLQAFPEDMPDWLKESIATKLREISKVKITTAASLEETAGKNRRDARDISIMAARLMGFTPRGG